MWFIFLGLGFALLIVGGLYVRWRLAGALTALGVRAGRVRVVRWVTAWLLFGYPALAVVTITLKIIRGGRTMPQPEGPAGVWLLLFPFFWALLVMIQALPFVLAADLAHLAARRRRPVGAARWRARAVVAAIVGFALYTPARILAEHETIRVRHFAVGPHATGAPPFRIAFVADLQQAPRTGALATRVVAEIASRPPDLVLSGGDWIDIGANHIATAAVTAGALRSRLGTYSVRGDHEHFAYIDRDRSVREVESALRARGVEMPNDELRWFAHAGKRIAVVFLGYNYIRRTPDAVVAKLLGEAEQGGADFTIAVSHQLDAHLMALLRDRVDLALGAHTHGGQINPVLGVIHVPLARLETRYIDGRYQVGGTTAIVTAGIGYSTVPFRYAAPGSLEWIDVHL